MKKSLTFTIIRTTKQMFEHRYPPDFQFLSIAIGNFQTSLDLNNYYCAGSKDYVGINAVFTLSDYRTSDGIKLKWGDNAQVINEIENTTKTIMMNCVYNYGITYKLEIGSPLEEKDFSSIQKQNIHSFLHKSSLERKLPKIDFACE